MHFKLKITDPKPDKDGNVQFTLDWIDGNGNKRGQYYRTNLDAYLEHLKSLGHTVDLVK